MAEANTITITLPHTKFNVAAANSKRSKLGKRELKGAHVEVDLSQIPEKILFSLITDAVTKYVQDGIKYSSLNQETCTAAELRDVMAKRLNVLKTGKAGASTRKPAQRDPVKAEARKILRQAFKELHEASGSEEELDARKLTSKISELFKVWEEWRKPSTSDERKEQIEAVAQLVENAMAQAKTRIDAQDNMSNILGEMLGGATKPKGETPTQKVKAAKAKAKAAGPSA